MRDIRSLPISVKTFPDELDESLWRRLCTANDVSERDMWKHLRDADPTLPARVSPHAAAQHIRALAGLTPKSSPRNNQSLKTMTFGIQPRWRGPIRRTTLCRRCTRGDTVTVTALLGPICVKHKRWHLDGEDIDVSTRTAHLTAQKKLNGQLRLRGAGYDSRIMQAIRELIFIWNTNEGRQASDEPHIIFERFPLEVEILTRLAQPDLVFMLIDGKRPQPVKALAVAEVVSSAMENRPARLNQLMAPGLDTKLPRYGRWDEVSGYAAALKRRMLSLTPLLMRYLDTRYIPDDRLLTARTTGR